MVIGKKGQEIEVLRKELAALTSGDVHLNINEVRKPELDAKLIAENIAQQLTRRVTFRRAMKRAVQSAMRLGAQGIKVACGGRLGGAEIARSEWYREGRVPLHTLRANVDFARATAHTPYGTCGVKVWVFRGEIMEHDPMAYDKRQAEAGPSHGRSTIMAGVTGHDAAQAHQVQEGLQGPDPWAWRRAAPISISAPTA